MIEFFLGVSLALNVVAIVIVVLAVLIAVRG